MARRKNSGILAVVAENQRKQRRQRESEQRALLAHQKEMERLDRASARAQARDERENRRLYQEHREADAARRTTELTSQVTALDAILTTGLGSPPPRLESLRLPVAVPPYDPGPLGVPVTFPDPRAYEPPPPRGLHALAPGARKQHEQKIHDSRMRFERDMWEAQGSERERLRRLDVGRQRYQDWADREFRRLTGHNRQVDDLARSAAQGDADAVPEYFLALMRLSSPWPDAFPDASEMGWDGEGRQLLVSWEFPGIEVVPAVTRIRYVKSDDRELEVKRPVGERREIYRRLLAQCALRVLHETFRAPLYGSDGAPLVRPVAFNGYVVRPDPATGKDGPAYLATVLTDRTTFESVDLTQVEPVRCVEGLKGRLSTRPDKLTEVRPSRLPSTLDSTTMDGAGEDIDLLRMDPGEFEDLVADLFRAMGLQTQTTARSRDGGVDVIATDPDPIRGGRMVIQVKRYESTIPPAVIRDLYGTVLHEGAIKGILVTTAGFGPGTYQFAEGKPLSLIDGTELVALLAQHGLGGRINRP